MVINLEKDLAAAILSPEVQEVLASLVREAVHEAIAESSELDELLDCDQAAKYLGMSRGAVQKAVSRGSIPAVRPGRRIRIRKGELLGRPRRKK